MKKLILFLLSIILLCSFVNAEVLEYKNLSNYGLSDYFLNKPDNANLVRSTSGQWYNESALDEIKNGRWRVIGSGGLLSSIDSRNITFDNSTGKQIFLEINMSMGSGGMKASEGGGARDTFDFNNAVAGKFRIGSGGSTVASSRTYFNANVILKAMYGGNGLMNFEIYNVSGNNALIENLTITSIPAVFTYGYMPKIYVYASDFNISWYIMFNASLLTAIYTPSSSPDTFTPNMTGLNRNMTNNTLGQLINFTCNNNVSNLYFGTNLTNLNIVINRSTNKWIVYNLNSTVITQERDYYFIANCNGSGNFNYTTLNFRYDITRPNIELRSNNFFTSNNLSVYSNYMTTPYLINLTLNDTLSEIYGFSINVSYPNGTSIYFYKNISPSYPLNNTFNYNSSVDFNSFKKNQMYNVEIYSSDTHTAKKIIPYTLLKQDSKEIEFKTEYKNTINVKSEDTADITITQDLDRVSYTYKFKDKLVKDRVFYTNSINGLVYLPSSKFRGHFIIGNGITEGNWLDYETSKTLDLPSVEKVSENLYKVTYKNIDGEITFNSIGGLNINRQNYKFYYGQYNLSQSPDPALSDITSYVYLNITYNGSISDINANLYFNGTFYNTGITKANYSGLIVFYKNVGLITTNIDLSIPYVWFVNVTQIDGSSYVFNTTSKDHLTRSWGLDDCTGYNDTAFYFKTYDEKTGNDLNTNVSFDINYYLYGESQNISKSYQSSRYNNNTFKFCKYPNNITLVGSFNSIISSSGYTSRTFKRYDILLNYDLLAYLLPIETSSNTILFKLIDSSSNPVTNALMTIYRNINGSNQIVYSSYSDFAGQVATYLDQLQNYHFTINSTQYPFKEFDLQPSDASLTYTIKLSSGGSSFYNNLYDNIRYRVLINGALKDSALINMSNSYTNYTFQVEGTNIQEIGINLTNHNYACIPSNCFSSSTSSLGGSVSVLIKANTSGTISTAYYFKINDKKIYVNDGLDKVITKLVESTYSMIALFNELNADLSPNTRTILAGGISVLAIGIGSFLGLYGMLLGIPIIFIDIILGLPQIRFIHPLTSIFLVIYGVGMILLFSLKNEG